MRVSLATTLEMVCFGHCLNIFCAASTVCWFLLPLLFKVFWAIPRHEINHLPDHSILSLLAAASLRRSFLLVLGRQLRRPQLVVQLVDAFR